MVVGERINPTGKKDLQESLRKDFSLISRMATEQTNQEQIFLILMWE